MKQRKKIGLALGSGGAKGLSHIGVIKALEESNIPIDMIAGASAGALVGGAYLALGSIQKLEKYVTSLTYKDLAWIFLDLGSSSGIIKGDKIEQYLKELCSDKVIESLSIPFAAIATEVSTGKAVALRRGSLASAIRASGSVPALIGSVYLDGKHLVDGGASCPVPVPIVKDLGADYVIAGNLDIYPFFQSDSSGRTPTVPVMGRTALEMLRFNLANLLCRDADLTIIPDVSHTSSFNLAKFVHGEEIIQKGYDAAMAMIPKIKEDLSL